MILPEKHTDPSLTVINISSIIIESLLSISVANYDDLLNSVIMQTSEKIRPLFQSSLIFLYTLGKISYDPETDMVRIVE